MKLCGFDVGLDHPFFLIAGTCVIESEQMALDTAGTLKEITAELGIPFIYKSSFDKANRSSGSSFRGLGMEKGLEILAKVKKEIGVPVLTDIHEIDEIKPVAAVVDVLQTPAFLCRQTDFIRACAQSGKPVNIKKGQFLAPHDMVNVIDKARAAAKEAGLPTDQFMACERGVSFGYNNLVSDMRSLAIMRETGAPVVFDATHSVHFADPADACQDADLVTTDVWTSMGFEAENNARLKAFDGWIVDQAKMRAPRRMRYSCTACPPTVARKWPPK